MAIQFKKATKTKSRLRLALIGPAGSGKTYTALSIAEHLAKPVAVVDTEHGSASKYAGQFDFDVVELESFHPLQYIEAIKAAAAAGYGTIILDSLTHAWAGKDGARELADQATKRMKSANSFAGWRDVTPLHNQMIEAILAAPLHVIATMRAKTEFVQEKDERTGKTTVRKIGMQPVQRDGVEFEFDVVADLDPEHNDLIIGKTRCPALSGKSFRRAGGDIASVLNEWLSEGVDKVQPTPPMPVVVIRKAEESPSVERELFEEDLRSAQSEEALLEIGAAIKATDLSESDRAALAKMYKAKRAELRAVHEATKIAEAMQMPVTVDEVNAEKVA